MVVDRGLPDSNLNNAAGGDRSNVAWGFAGDYTSGDSFNLPELDAGNSAWRIDRISIWSIAGEPGSQFGDSFDSVSLYLGPDEADAELPEVASGNVSGNSTDNPDIAITPTSYADGSSYQGSGGGFTQIWQLDFSNLGFFAPGDYLFGADGSGANDPIWFNHASDAGLSGTPQQGSDDLYNWFAVNGSGESITLGGAYDSDGNGWDKSSDINIQVHASQVPEPGMLGMLGLGLLGMAGMRRLRR